MSRAKYDANAEERMRIIRRVNMAVAHYGDDLPRLRAALLGCAVEMMNRCSPEDREELTKCVDNIKVLVP